MQDIAYQKILSIMITILTMMSSLIQQPIAKPLASEAIIWHDVTPSEMILGSTLPIGGTTYNISGPGISSSATSITLASLTIPQTGQKLLDSDFSSTFYITVDPGNRTRQEFVSCTTVAQNAAGTATLSGCSRGLSPITPYTASTTLQIAHGGSAQVIFSDPPQLFNEYAAKSNNETITGSWLFPTPLVGSNAVTKDYADALSIQGAATSTESNFGISQLATASQTALGTASSTTGAPLVIKNSTATSSNDVAQTHVVVTQTNGTIKPNLIDQTSAYTWSGLHTFTGTATTTFSATTTMASVNLTNPPTGNLSRLLLATTTNASIGTASTTVFSVTVPANVLYNTGYNGVVRTRVNLSAFSMTTNDTWQMEVLYGGTSVCCMATSTESPHDVNNGGTTFSGGGGYIDIELYGNNSNNAQEVYITPVLNAIGTTNNVSASYPFKMNPKLGSLSIDSTLPQTLQIKVKTIGGTENTVSQVSSYLMR